MLSMHNKLPLKRKCMIETESFECRRRASYFLFQKPKSFRAQRGIWLRPFWGPRSTQSQIPRFARNDIYWFPVAHQGMAISDCNPKVPARCLHYKLEQRSPCQPRFKVLALDSLCPYNVPGLRNGTAVRLVQRYALRRRSLSKPRSEVKRFALVAAVAIKLISTLVLLTVGCF